MSSRRDFLKRAALLAASGGLGSAFPGAIQRAFAINPASGSTYLDAEHVIVLMQENRSFDHTYGTLRGVRGFDDPRAMRLPNGNPVWLQSNAAGETYAPFRLDIKDTKATWMGSLPHGWIDQAEARNEGKHDRWLPAKASGREEYAHLPLTLGYYTREDIPFYYALADAFTVCDQNFCSSLTATEPNRLHLWTGTVRAEASIRSKAYVRNEDMGYDLPLSWTTFPERLEKHGVSWRIYQNELSVPSGFSEEADAWLSNFDDNPLEYFTRYHVRFLRTHRRYLAETERTLTAELNKLKATVPGSNTIEAQIKEKSARLEDVQRYLQTLTDEEFAKLPSEERNLHRKAFTTNEGDADYRELTTMTYRDGTTERTMQVPKGDVLYQFRKDVQTDKLPTISWLIAPERFSDHPSSAWFGAWYISETLDILTQNPEIWKKAIFILCYDENDGYFDHVPPFVPPVPGHKDTGKVSAGIDPSVEYVSAEEEDEIRKSEPDWRGQSGPIGLGFRVPLVIASPWSRGGRVCSQIFDHTSILQFMEKFLTNKTGRPIQESNISAWRRTVCGDLSSTFRPYSGEKIALPQPVEREFFFRTINDAQFKAIPNDFRKLSPQEIAEAGKNSAALSWFPRQESGTRAACALPYELEADGALSQEHKSFVIVFSAGRTQFGERAAGAPFRVYAPGSVRGADRKSENGHAWDYTVAAGDRITDEWSLNDFGEGIYHLCVYGPNGFFREFRGNAEDPRVTVKLRPAYRAQAVTADAELQLENHDTGRSVTVTVADPAYGNEKRVVKIGPAASAKIVIGSSQSFGWYDLAIRVEDRPHFEHRYAGHVETGEDSFSDPLIGKRTS